MSNIVLLCGTSGSGKTYIAQKIIDELGPSAFRHEMRGKTSGYVWDDPPVALAGRYDSACGGCDALSWKGAADDVEAQVMQDWRLGRSVLMEGLIVASWGVPRLLRMHVESGGSLRVVHLTTPLEVCLASVNARRAERAAARGRPATEVNPENTTSKWRGFHDGVARRIQAGLDVYELDRAAALLKVKEWLDVPS